MELEWKNLGWETTEHETADVDEEMFEVDKTEDVLPTPGGWLLEAKVSSPYQVAVCSVAVPDPDHRMQWSDSQAWGDFGCILHDHETYKVETFRDFVKVPLGWVIRTILISENGMVAVGLTYIDDPQHEMDLKPEADGPPEAE